MSSDSIFYRIRKDSAPFKEEGAAVECFPSASGLILLDANMSPIPKAIIAMPA